MANRKTILNLAELATNGDRDKKYGKPENNFAAIARLWNAYFNTDQFNAHDVAMMLALMKVARIRSGMTEDSYVDLVGYAACAGEIAAGERNND